MAQGMRQGILATCLVLVPKMKGKEVANAVADCMAGKPNSAMLLLGMGSAGGVVELGWKELRGMGVPVAKAEGAFDLVDGGSLANEADVFVEGAAVAAVDEVGVNEDEGLLDVKADGDNVYGVLQGKLVAIFERELRGVEELLVIGQHDHQGNIENLLEISSSFSEGRCFDAVYSMRRTATHFVNSKGIECPTCILSLLGPLPV